MSLGAGTGFRLQIRLNRLLLINLDWCMHDTIKSFAYMTDTKIIIHGVVNKSLG